MNARPLARATTILTLLLTVASPAVLYATTDVSPDAHRESVSGASAHGAEAPEPSIGELSLRAVNFAIYLFIMLRYAVPVLREQLRRRRAEVVLADSEASSALAQAEQAMATNNARLAALATEAESIRRDLVAVATRQAERLTAQAEDTGRRRLTDAALVAEQERRRALAAVRADIALLATNLAERRIRAALTPADQRTFVQQFLKGAAGR